jgi:signal transduction histidine kinase
VNIFDSAVKKLTLWYVSALFVVCMVFSVPVYVVTSARLENAARKQVDILRQFDPFSGPLPTRIGVLRDQQLNHDRQQLLKTIIVVNLAILGLGAFFSYRFARRTLKPIEEAHTAQARFTTDASHELRTPLATMQAEIEVALRDKKFDPAQARGVLNSNLEEIARLRSLSEQLLNLTRLDNSKLQKAPLSFSKLVQDEIKALEKRRHISVTADIAKDLSLLGDKQLLCQLLTILTDNAVKYAGDKPPVIELSLKKQDNTALLTFTDHGIGIKASELPHVFERFYRGTNAARQDGDGHGLGLSLAQQIVEAHGGNISAESKVGNSTTFVIALPSSA